MKIEGIIYLPQSYNSLVITYCLCEREQCTIPQWILCRAIHSFLSFLAQTGSFIRNRETFWWKNYAKNIFKVKKHKGFLIWWIPIKKTKIVQTKTVIRPQKGSKLIIRGFVLLKAISTAPSGITKSNQMAKNVIEGACELSCACWLPHTLLRQIVCSSQYF